MDSPAEVAKHEPRKSLFIILLMSLGGIIIGLVALYFGIQSNAPVAQQAGYVLAGIGVVGLITFFVARLRQPKVSSQREKQSPPF